jgi:hypothetical protein
MREGGAAARWPWITAALVDLALTAVLVTGSLRENQGRLVYPLDDTYIHMAMAKHTALHGVWGVTPHGFSSSTSSPLWTALLAAVWRVTGVHDAVPLVLNAACALALLAVADRILRVRAHASPAARCVALLALVLVAPLPTLTVIGMEHVLHALLALVIADRAAAWLAERPPERRLPDPVLLAAAALLPATRYEGALLLGAIAALFAIARRPLAGLALLAAGALPVTAYGWWSQAHGWPFLPASVLLKGNIPSATGASLVRWVYAMPQALAVHGHVLMLIAAALALLLAAVRHRRRDHATWLLAIFALGALAHVQFAKLGWFFRYEAYLVALGVIVLAVAVAPWAGAGRISAWMARASHPERALVLALALVAGSPWLIRAVSALANTVHATTNIHDQQFQMGRFLARHYAGSAVAVNDIGAVGYLADIRLCDLWGLGSIEVARLRRAGRFDTAAIAEIAERAGVEIAIVYESWYRNYGGLPPGWRALGTWRVAYNVILGGDTVTLYAVAPGSDARLIANLRAYAAELPPDVEQAGAYRERAD